VAHQAENGFEPPASPVPALALRDPSPLLPVFISAGSYAKAAASAGDAVRLQELPGVEHFELIDPLSHAWGWVIESLVSVLLTENRMP
jgi:hypothetical protein